MSHNFACNFKGLYLTLWGRYRKLAGFTKHNIERVHTRIMNFWEKRRFLGGSSLILGLGVLVASGFWLGTAFADGWYSGTQAPNAADAENGISNTRHNLTMSYSSQQGVMGTFRNNYYEVCVYCHTPHGANSTAAAPLWNRTVTNRNYTLYDNSSSLAGGNMSQPGANSLTCLSCHDGITAIDSVINMPTQLGGAYRAGYNVNQESGINVDFLNAWGAPGNDMFDRVDGNGDALLAPQTADLPDNGAGQGHSGLANFGDGSSPCIACHTPSPSGGRGVAPSFDAFLIGTQSARRVGGLDSDGLQSLDSNVRGGAFLADDHPIGVSYPSEFGAGSGYNEPDIMNPKIAFWDLNDNQHADPNEVRLYDTGEGYEVECGSCHDPHGVKVSNDDSAAFIPSFLRIGDNAVTDASQNVSFLSSVAGGVSANAGSKLCLTCHVK
jgi:mono/diheme cytochrome c family protein